MKYTAEAHPNIAFIKYWGNADHALRLPQNGSISMNLGTLCTRTSVEFRDIPAHELTINGNSISGTALTRVSKFMERIKIISGETRFARIVSENNFPMGAGIASSASAFAALALAGSHAAGLSLNEEQLSRLARLGSGSACRSIPAGYAEWQKGEGDEDSFALSIAAPNYWSLIDWVVVVSDQHKKTGSTVGHVGADSSAYQPARVMSAPERLEKCRAAILNRDFISLAEVSERDSTMMHAVMMTQTPPLFYWEPLSLRIMHQVAAWRDEGTPCFFTLDAGPNVHVICPESVQDDVKGKLLEIVDESQLIRSGAGEGAKLI